MKDLIELFIDELSKDWNVNFTTNVEHVLLDFNNFCETHNINFKDVSHKTVEAFLKHQQRYIYVFLDFVKKEGL